MLSAMFQKWILIFLLEDYFLLVFNLRKISAASVEYADQGTGVPTYEMLLAKQEWKFQILPYI